MALRDDLVAIGVPIPEELSLSLERFAAALTDSPCRNNFAVVGLSALAFLAAERGHNAKCRDIYDAMVYTSTCLSVGYGDIFARTPVGKVIGTVLMTIGPALSGAALDGPAKDRPDETQDQILSTLREILRLLEAQTPQAE